MTEELEFTIDTAINGERVFVDKFDDDALWLSVSVRSARAHVTMTKKQTQQLIAALIEVEKQL